MVDENTIFDLTKPYFFKKGPVGVVLVHGFTSSPNDMRALGEYLAVNNFTVYGLRLAGHGVSHHALRKTNRYDWFYSLKMAVEEMRPQVKKIFLIGFSMGGNLSLLFSELERGVDGLILINTPIFTKQKRWLFWLIPLIKRFKKFSTKEWVKNMDHYFEKRDSGSYFRIPLESAWQFYKLVQETKSILPSINLPVYIIQSTHDETIDPQSANYLFLKLHTADKRIEFIPTEKHNILANYSHYQDIYTKICHYLCEKSL